MPVLSSVISFARTQAQTDSNGLSDANGVIFANEALLDFRRKLVEKGVDAGQVQEFVQEGTVNDGTYTYPTNPSILFLKTIELNYSSTRPDGYIKANQLDVANIPGNKSVGWIRTNASPQSPYFDDRGDSYEIFPTPTAAHNVTSLITLFYFKKPTEYSAVGDNVAYPESIDLRILGWRVAANYLNSLGKTDDAMVFNMKYEEKVQGLVSTLARGSQQPIQATPLSITGFEF